MAELVADCPRCGTRRITFEVKSGNILEAGPPCRVELFGVCRECTRSTIFKAVDFGFNHAVSSIVELLHYAPIVNKKMKLTGYVSTTDISQREIPEHLPGDIDAIFREATACFSVGCWNACGVMLRLCLEISTKSLLPAGATIGLNYRTRRDLGLRIKWLFDQNKITRDLMGLSSCLHQDGNDAAHAGSLSKADAEDLFDFAEALLKRLYTEPKRLELAEERRLRRRTPQDMEQNQE